MWRNDLEFSEPQSVSMNGLALEFAVEFIVGPQRNRIAKTLEMTKSVRSRNHAFCWESLSETPADEKVAISR